MASLGHAAPGTAAPTERWRILFTAAALVAATLSGMLLGAVMREGARTAAQNRAASEAALLSASLRINLQQYRDLPTILATDQQVMAAIDGPLGARASDALSARFESLSNETRARAIYVMGPDGVTRSASNWRTGASFVGQDYSFRPYFRDSIANGSAEFFALGTISAAPGLYIGRRLQSPQGRKGVVVVKVQFDELEAEWRASGSEVLVIDHDGVVLLAGRPEWRFNTTQPLSAAALAAIRETRQYGEGAAMPPLPVSLDRDQADMAVASAAVPGTTWTVWLLASSRGVETEAQRNGRMIGALAALLLASAIGVLIARRRRALAQQRRGEEARVLLEHKVQERTRDLDSTNVRLSREIGERQRAQSALQDLQAELAQSNRLAVLGQISAGVAHEINQPLAAIRSFSENATALLDRGDQGAARGNLATITGLTDRIARITDELRAMSRRGSGPKERVAIQEALDGALLLLGAPLRSGQVRFERLDHAPGVAVHAHRMRVEQVLINLLQNALEAVGETSSPHIRVAVERRGDTVEVTVEDNGPGLDPDLANKLFTPFQTSKPKGLGLGLVISRDICREYGGGLDNVPGTMGGAAFRFALPVAP